MRLPSMAVLVALGLLATACSESIEIEPKRPDVVGWVVDAHQTADYVYEDLELRSGSIVLSFQDGSEVVVDSSTELASSCQSFLGPEGSSKPCWLHVGLAPDQRTAVWVTPFRVLDWEGRIEPAEVPFVRDLARVVAAPSSGVAMRTDTELILLDGTVLPWDRASVTVILRGGATPSSMDRMLTSDEGRTLFVVDDETGALTALGWLFKD